MYGNNINNKGKIEKNKKIKEGPCIFPFMYKWKSHNKCLTTPKGNICATKISLPRRTLKRKGYCIKKRTKKKARKKIDKSKVKKKGTFTLKKLNKKKINTKKTIKIKKLKKKIEATI